MLLTALMEGMGMFFLRSLSKSKLMLDPFLLRPSLEMLPKELLALWVLGTLVPNSTDLFNLSLLRVMLSRKAEVKLFIIGVVSFNGSLKSSSF